VLILMYFRIHLGHVACLQASHLRNVSSLDGHAPRLGAAVSAARFLHHTVSGCQTTTSSARHNALAVHLLVTLLEIYQLAHAN
jgi:hypothetical protein